jgi:hypothetical protein
LQPRGSPTGRRTREAIAFLIIFLIIEGSEPAGSLPAPHEAAVGMRLPEVFQGEPEILREMLRFFLEDSLPD